MNGFPDLGALDGATPVVLRRARVPLPFLAPPPAGAEPDRDGRRLARTVPDYAEPDGGRAG